MFNRNLTTPVTVSLRRLLPSVSFVGCADIHAVEVTESSNECGPRTLFAAIPGTQVDGTHFISEAISRGARALLVQRPLAGVSVPQCVVPNVRKAYAEICAALAGTPSQSLKLAGVTGTNGKTTVTWLIRSILQADSRQAGVLGTIEYHDGVSRETSTLTTPDSKTLSKWLASMVQCGTTHAAIELSSHALDQDRAAGTMLDVAVVTNITQDHFDYHQDFQSYWSSKTKILNHRKTDGWVVLNVDDPGSASMLDLIDGEAKVLTFGLDRPAHVTATITDESLAGTSFLLNHCGQKIDIRTRLIGRHNVRNCLAAAAAALRMGASPEAVARGIEALESVPGRLERVDGGQLYEIIVDYAHTPDALQRCLDGLRQLTDNRVICVFGAGGDRDRAKRPLLGRAASTADLAVVTSDNPRSENPDTIIQEVLAGFPRTRQPPHIEPNRALAIRWALQQAEPGDCVLVAGKGHETEQVIGDQRLPFDDREVIRALLRDRNANFNKHGHKVIA